MKKGLTALILVSIVSLILSGDAEAKLKRYKYVQEVSKLDWQLLNWTSAWRGTAKPADPFILDRMEYDHTLGKVTVYLTGKSEQASDENLNKSVDSIISLFRSRFPELDPKEELAVYYEISSEKEPKLSYIEYSGAQFNKNAVPPQGKAAQEAYTY